MFLKDKYDAEGTFTKVKARLAARGDQQSEYDLLASLLSSPTANLMSVFVLLSIAAKFKAFIRTLDVPGAYLHALLDEDIYMRLPKECIDIWCKLNNIDRNEYIHNDNIYVKLNKALYGLRQSSVLWYNTLISFLKVNGYQQSNIDPCVLIKRNGPEEFTIIAIYVDDLLIVSTHESNLNDLQSKFEAQYGKISYQQGPKISFLSMLISQSSDRTVITVDQDNYISSVLSNFESKYAQDGLSLSNYPSNSRLFHASDPNSEKIDRTKYLSTLMSLMYAAIRTRPDILKEATYLATKSAVPYEGDWDNLVQILCYLKANPSKKVYFRHSDSKEIEFFADASFRIHTDTGSHTGIIGKLFGNPILFKSGKQKILSKSSCEAELIALDEAATFIVWLMELLESISIPFITPSIIYQDNTSTMTIAKSNKGNFKRTKHIASKYFWVKQFIDSDEVILIFVPSERMEADILTKVLVGMRFNQNIPLLFNEKQQAFLYPMHHFFYLSSIPFPHYCLSYFLFLLFNYSLLLLTSIIPLCFRSLNQPLCHVSHVCECVYKTSP
jgi:hypothetical protein